MLILFKNGKIIAVMKNAKRIAILITLTVLLVCALTPFAASADSSSNENIFYSPKGYSLSVLKVDGVIVGARFYGLYFSRQGIAVTAEIYSSDGFTIDFPVNADPNVLTDEQKACQAKLFALGENIHDLITAVDSAANTQYDGTGGYPTSDIYRYNQAAGGNTLKVSKHTYDMLLIAKEMYLATGGAFNPAVYRLVDLWGFSSRTYYRNGNLPYDRTWQEENGYPLPEQKYIEAFSSDAFTDFSDSAVTLYEDNGEYFVKKNVADAVVDGISYPQWLDLGGIAKGCVTDLIREMLTEQGAVRYYVNAGSSSIVFGRNYLGDDSVLSLSDPFSPMAEIYADMLLSVNVGNCSVSSSGQYIRKYSNNGVEYAHIIDGKSGAPAQTGVKLVTVVAPEGNLWAGKGDCLTTALTVMGRDGIVEFMNGYLKTNGIQVIVAYETVDGQKQILSNLSQDDIIAKGKYYDEYAWGIKSADGEFSYDFDATAPKNSASNYIWLYVTLGVLGGLCIVGVITYHYVKGKRNVASNIINAKRDKPFKLGDIGVYLCVLVVIAALFVGFFGGDETSNGIRVINVVDMTKSAEGEILFTYNVARNDWIAYANNSMGWQIQVERIDGGIKVVFSREIDGEEHFNEMTITRGVTTSVKMTDSVCGYHQECVKNFPAITRPNGSIVCSPNRLKVVSE